MRAVTPPPRDATPALGPCPVCHSVRVLVDVRANGAGDTLRRLRCLECGHTLGWHHGLGLLQQGWKRELGDDETYKTVALRRQLQAERARVERWESEARAALPELRAAAAKLRQRAGDETELETATRADALTQRLASLLPPERSHS